MVSPVSVGINGKGRANVFKNLHKLQQCTIKDMKISVDFLNPDDGLPKVAACTRKLRKPVVHENYTEFKEGMMKALEVECQGFADY